MTEAPGTQPIDGMLVDVSRLVLKLNAFARDRDWEQFHSPKNLVMALSVECGELTELFQWMTEEQSRSAMNDERTAQAIRSELADILFYLVQVASRLGIDLDEAARTKLHVNALKYPVERSRGTSLKYTQLPRTRDP